MERPVLKAKRLWQGVAAYHDPKVMLELVTVSVASSGMLESIEVSAQELREFASEQNLVPHSHRFSNLKADSE